MSTRRKGNLTILLVCALIFFATSVANAQQQPGDHKFIADTKMTLDIPNLTRGPEDHEGAGSAVVNATPLPDGNFRLIMRELNASLTGSFRIRKNPNRPSEGRIILTRQNQGPFSGESFIEFPPEGFILSTAQGDFTNTAPFRVEAVIDDNIPPLSNTYRFAGSIPLRGPGGRTGRILRISHHPRVPGSPGGTPRAVLSPYLVGVWQLRDFPNFFSPSREDTLFTIINPTAFPLAVQVKILDDRENAIACGRVRPPLSPSDMVEVNVRQFLVLNGVPIPPTQVGVVQAVSFLPPGPPQNALLKTGIVGYLKNFITDGDDPADTLSPFERALNVISHAKEELKPVPDKDLDLRQFLTCPPGRTFDIPSHPPAPAGSSKTKDGSSTGVAKKQDVESHKVEKEAKTEIHQEQ